MTGIDSFVSVGAAASAVVDKLADQRAERNTAARSAAECLPKVERHACRDDAHWKALRSHDVTASVAAALLGEHEYETAYALYMHKIGAVVTDLDDSGPIRRGRLLEPVAVQVLREEHPSWRIIHNDGRERVYYREAETRLGATPDVLVDDPQRGPGVVQIKSVEAGIYRRKWLANAETPEPPIWIAVQAIIEATLTGSKWAAVAPIVVGHGVDMPLIPIPIHAAVMARVRSAVAEFWRRVERREPYAPDYRRDGATIAAIYGAGDNGGTVDLTGWNRGPELADEDERLASEIKERADRRKAIKAELLDKIGPAAVATIDGRVFATAKTVCRKGYEVKPSQYRDIRFKRGLAS